MSEPVKPAAARGSEAYLVELEHYAEKLETEAENFYRAHSGMVLGVAIFVSGALFDQALRLVL